MNFAPNPCFAGRLTVNAVSAGASGRPQISTAATTRGRGHTIDNANLPGQLRPSSLRKTPGDTPAHTTTKPKGTQSYFRCGRCVACGTLLVWALAADSARCEVCQLIATVVPRSVPQPCLPTAAEQVVMLFHPPTFVATDIGDAAAALLAGQQLGLAMASVPVEYFRWASIRTHPQRGGMVVICDAEEVVAVVPRRGVAYWRALLLDMWSRHAPSLVMNENDVAATILHWGRVVKWCSMPEVPRRQFRGQHHCFARWQHVCEPGYLRTAVLQRKVGKLVLGDPAVSAYTCIRRWGAPLDPAGYTKLYSAHPHYPLLINGLFYGYPLLSVTPQRTRGWLQRSSELDDDPRSLEALLSELEMGAFIAAPNNIPLRFAPLNPVISNKLRLVSDFSIGKESVNNNTRRGVVPRARLAKLVTLAKRILYMKQQRPHERVMLVKADVSAAFRRVPLPEADFHRTAHHTAVGDVVHVRLPLGASTSCDMMALGITALVDTVMSSLGTFCDSFVDDVIWAVYESEACATGNAIMAVWQSANWPLNEKKFVLDGDGTPATTKVILGVLVDTEACTMSVSVERKDRLLTELQQWTQHPTTPRRRREFMSLAGKLQFISNVLPFGRVFLRRLYKAGAVLAGSGMQSQHMRIPVPDGVIQDLRWWIAALASFNGIASFMPLASGTPVTHVTTDAAKYGLAAVNHTTSEYCTAQFEPLEQISSSTAMWEGAGVAVAVAVFAMVPGSVMWLQSDSAACVAMFNSLRCDDESMYELLRFVALLQIQSAVRLIVTHIPGVLNVLADTGSRTGALPEGALFQRVEVPQAVREHTRGILTRSYTPASEGQAIVHCQSRPQSNGSLSSATRGGSPSTALYWSPWTHKATASFPGLQSSSSEETQSWRPWATMSAQ